MLRPSRVNTAPVGYQPVGMKPLTKARDALLTSMTATAFMSALATMSVLPSGDRLSAFGVVAGGASGDMVTAICSMGASARVSNDHTAALFAQATNSRRPSLENVIAFGCSSVVSSAYSASESA